MCGDTAAGADILDNGEISRAVRATALLGMEIFDEQLE